MDLIHNIIQELNSINLEEMDAVKLMNRTDTKYIFHINKLPKILEGIKNDYKILEVAQSRICPYESLYFDTQQFDLYMKHHNGRLNRYKVRFRRYATTGQLYFEIKFKNNKSRTIKSRIKQKSITNEISDAAGEFLLTQTNISPELLVPICWVNYSRLTFVNNNLRERLTIDIDLTLKNDNGTVKFEPLVIAELKQNKSSERSAFAKLMQEARIKKNSISKYCLGVTQLFPKVKRNNFKPKLLTLNKILYATS
jgi:hypothetical protein